METTAYNSEFNDEESGTSNKPNNNDNVQYKYKHEVPPYYNKILLTLEKIKNVEPPKDNMSVFDPYLKLLTTKTVMTRTNCIEPVEPVVEPVVELVRQPVRQPVVKIYDLPVEKCRDPMKVYEERVYGWDTGRGTGGGEGSGGALCVLLFIISLIVMACILTHEKKLHLASQPTSQPTRF